MIKWIELQNKIKHFAQSEDGATAIEYGIIAAGISVVIVGAVSGIGAKVGALFTGVASVLN